MNAYLKLCAVMMMGLASCSTNDSRQNTADAGDPVAAELCPP